MNAHADRADDADLAEVLRGSGNRLTQARRLVWDVLGSNGHLTVAEIADAVAQRDASINRSSVYRALETFAELDLVRESRTDATGSSTWERRHSDGVIHLVCTECEQVVHHRTAAVDRLRAELTAAGYDPTTIDIRVDIRCCNTGV